MQETVVEAGSGMRQYWRDLWRYRELVGILAWRDLSVRYKQAVLGVAWSVVRPIMTTIVFTVIFGKLAQFPSTGVPYPILVLSGLLVWQFFASALESTSGSIIGNANLVSKVYFPRLVIPLSSMAVSSVDLVINMVLLAGVMLWFGFLPPIQVFFLPTFLFLTMLFTLGLGFWLSSLSAKYRDFRIIVPFAVQLGFYISPVGFQSAVVPEQWQWLYALNPMVGLIDGVRWCILGSTKMPTVFSLATTLGTTILFLGSGIAFFRSQERKFADVI